MNNENEYMKAVEEELSDQATEETKAARFKRVATKRINNALHDMRLLSNCANLASYEYTPEQVTTIVTHLEVEIERIKDAFNGKVENATEISL